MRQQVTKAQKEEARDLAGKAIRQIFDAAQVLADVRPILTAEDKQTVLRGKQE